MPRLQQAGHFIIDLLVVYKHSFFFPQFFSSLNYNCP